MDQGTTPVGLEIERGVEPISGWCTAPDGMRVRFVGWVELVSRLAALVTPPEIGSQEEAGHPHSD